MKSDNIFNKMKGKDNWNEEKSHKSEYIVAIIFNLIFFYIVNNLLNWNISFITQALNSILWIINLSIVAAITGNFFLLLYDPRWLRHLIKIAMNIFAFYAVYFIYEVFPFSFSTIYLDEIVLFVLIISMVAIIIASFVEFIKLILLIKGKFLD